MPFLYKNNNQKLQTKMSKIAFSPESLSIDNLSAKVDLAKAEENYQKKPNSFIYMVDLKNNDKPFLLKLKGELKCDAIIVNQEYSSHSLKMQLEDSTTLFNECTKFFNPGNNRKYTPKDFVDDEDSLYLKLKYKRDKSKYSFECNKPIFPKNPSAADIESGEEVTAVGKLSLYFNLEDHTCGFSFKLSNLLI